jgi:hypothetical protein
MGYDPVAEVGYFGTRYPIYLHKVNLAGTAMLRSVYDLNACACILCFLSAVFAD